MFATEIDPSYFHVPDHSTLAISKDAKVLDLVRNLVLPEVIRYDGYRRVKTIGYGELHIHRLLALTFLPTTETPKKLFVNHKDGIKTNLNLGNLEWVTPSENSLHAYRTGLRNDNREVSSRDLITGEELSFYSLNECARSFGVNPEKVHRYLNGDRISAFELKYTLRYNDSDWPDCSQIAPFAILRGQPRPVIAEELCDGRKFVFGSITAAAEILELVSSSISYALNNKEIPIHGNWRFWYLDCYDGGDLDDIEIRKVAKVPRFVVPKRKPVPIRVTDTTDGSVTDWISTEVFGKSVGVKKNTIQKAVLVNGGKWRHFLVEYLT